MMRIMNVMLSAGVGGLEAVAFQYARVLASAGCESAMVVNRRSPCEAPDDVMLFRAPGASLRNPFNPLAVARAVRTFRPDVVIGHGSRGADFCKSPLVRAAASGRCRFVGALHGENAKHFHGLDHVIAVSETLRAGTIAKYGFAPERISAVPNAVAVPDMTEGTRREPQDGTPIIGFLGRFDPCKGLDVLLEACALLKGKGLRFRLVVGGAGPKEADLKARSGRLGLTEDVRWLGWVSNKQSFFSQVDAVVLPSREEGLPLALLEAMSFVRAVVVSDCPSMKEVVEGAACGLVVPRGDAVALAGALERLLGNGAERERFASAGRAVAERQYSESGLTGRLLRILRDVGP